jgi:hypothetical protein
MQTTRDQANSFASHASQHNENLQARVNTTEPTVALKETLGALPTVSEIQRKASKLYMQTIRNQATLPRMNPQSWHVVTSLYMFRALDSH